MQHFFESSRFTPDVLIGLVLSVAFAVLLTFGFGNPLAAMTAFEAPGAAFMAGTLGAFSEPSVLLAIGIGAVAVVGVAIYTIIGERLRMPDRALFEVTSVEPLAYDESTRSVGVAHKESATWHLSSLFSMTTLREHWMTLKESVAMTAHSLRQFTALHQAGMSSS